MSDVSLRERVSTLEANQGNMKESIKALATEIAGLNQTLSSMKDKASTAIGVFIAVFFILNAIIIPLALTIVSNKLNH